MRACVCTCVSKLSFFPGLPEGGHSGQQQQSQSMLVLALLVLIRIVLKLMLLSVAIVSVASVIAGVVMSRIGIAS